MTQHQASRSSGMGNLDNKFERGGIIPGAVVALQSPPEAQGQVVLYNLCAGRPTTYLTLGTVKSDTESLLRDAGELSPDELTVETVPATVSAQELRDRIDAIDLPTGGTLLVEPTNVVESNASQSEYASVLDAVSQTVEVSDGLAGLLALNTDQAPANRWQTLHRADMVMTVTHEVSNRSVHDHLALEKLHPRQTLREADDRVFRLPRSLAIDIDTKQNLSP